ncbi:MAG: PAS domain-containing sensor histidine kinase [bacterium]
MKKNSKPETIILRQQAEELMKIQPSKISSQLTQVEAVLIHELEVHQIELEMQNDELTRTIASAQDALDLYDFAPVGYFVLTEESTIIKLNLSGANLLSKVRSELIDCRFGFFVSDDTRAIFNKFLVDVFAGRTKITCEVTLSIHNELPVFARLNGISTNEKDRCLVNVSDITENKKIAAGLEKTRKELEVIKIAADEISEFAENLINTVREPLLALDKDLRVVKASRSFYDFFKVTPDVTIGKLVYELGNNQWDIPKLRELLETILPEMTTFDNYEVEHNFSTIGKRNMLLNARQIEREMGKDKIILLAIEDITERRQAEELIKIKNDEIHKVHSEKDKFFSIIGHDLRSPFNSFLGLTQIMAEELPTLSINEIQENATNMQSSAINLYRLLGNLLDWSLIQQGLFPFDPTLVQLLPMVNESIALAVETAKGKNIEILVSVPEDLAVFADNNTLQTVIRNLVSNAVKFTPKGGKIMVSAKMTDDKNVEISVKDTGIGMDKYTLDNLFKLDVNTCRKGTEGELSTGLGLLLCKDFIEKHGGKLGIESQEGMGSTFYFTVPVGK